MSFRADILWVGLARLVLLEFLFMFLLIFLPGFLDASMCWCFNAVCSQFLFLPIFCLSPWCVFLHVVLAMLAGHRGWVVVVLWGFGTSFDVRPPSFALCGHSSPLAVGEQVADVELVVFLISATILHFLLLFRLRVVWFLHRLFLLLLLLLMFTLVGYHVVRRTGLFFA